MQSVPKKGIPQLLAYHKKADGYLKFTRFHPIYFSGSLAVMVFESSQRTYYSGQCEKAFLKVYDYNDELTSN